MVLTPQLLQAIKLLQMPNAELTAFIESELERNPLLERAEDRRVFEAAVRGERAHAERRAEQATGRPRRSRPTPRRWRAISAPKSTTPSTLDRAAPTPRRRLDEGLGLSATSWTGAAPAAAAAMGDEAPDLEAYVAES